MRIKRNLKSRCLTTKRNGAVTVLDIDLDYFLNERPWKSDSGRHRAEDHAPWSEEKFRNFLTTRCNLSTEAKLPGYFIRTHDEAFSIWSQLIIAGTLTTPFNVVHIDSHADLGCGSSGSCILPLCNEITHLPVDERLHHILEANMVNEGNFLLLSVALRWINKIFYVAHPEVYEPPIPDVDYPFLGILVKRCGPSNPMCSEITLFKSTNWNAVNIYRPPITAFEPPTPIEVVRQDEFYTSGKPHHAIVCLSPAYTPPESDMLMEIAKEYIYDLTGAKGSVREASY